VGDIPASNFVASISAISSINEFQFHIDPAAQRMTIFFKYIPKGYFSKKENNRLIGEKINFRFT
jgi:hypothetical protein